MFVNISKSDHNLSKSKGYWIYGSDMFNKDGYLEKEMKIISLDTNNINPTLDEITKFTGGAIGENQTDLAELSITSGTAVASTEDFFVGEHVEVTEGELINLHGIVKSVDNDIVSIIPADSEELDTVCVQDILLLLLLFYYHLYIFIHINILFYIII